MANKQIKDYTLKTGISGNEDILIQDNGITKRIKSSEFGNNVDLSNYYSKKDIDNLLLDSTNSEENKLRDLSLYEKSDSENKLNDSEIKGKVYNGSFNFVNLDRKNITVGKYFRLRIYFEDGSQVKSSNAVWKFNYTDGTVSGGTSSVTSQRLVEKEVESIRVEFVGDAKTMYANKVYSGAKLSDISKDDSEDYISFESIYESETIENIFEQINVIDKNALGSDDLYVKTSNLFDPTDIEYGLELQPYNIIDNTNMNITGYIPINTGDSIYTYPNIGGAQVANLYDSDKKRIGWMNLSTSGNVKNDITTENVSYIRFNFPAKYDLIKDKFVVSKNKVVKYEPFKAIDNSKLIISNTNINFWENKIGDSLGDSLTGQGFFQLYTSRYLNLNSFSNHGVGGSKLSGEDIDESKPSMWKDERINELRDDADFITILGGQNDPSDTLIGEISKTNMDTNTYVGALNTIISKIYTKYNNNIQIILCTPFYVPSEGDDGERFVNLDKAVIEVGRLHGLPVADFGGMSGANKYTKNIYWGSSDKTHPLEAFYRDRITPILVSTMEHVKPIDYEKCNYIE